MDDAEQYADEVHEIHGRADQLEWHMESAGFSEAEISEQLQRLGYRRVYALETCSPPDVSGYVRVYEVCGQHDG